MSDENNVDPLSWLLPYLLMKCCGKFNAGTILSFLSWKYSGYWYWYIISIQMLPKIIFTFDKNESMLHKSMANIFD